MELPTMLPTALDSAFCMNPPNTTDPILQAPAVAITALDKPLRLAAVTVFVAASTNSPARTVASAAMLSSVVMTVPKRKD